MTREDIDVLEEILVQIRYQVKQGVLPSGLVPLYATEADGDALSRILDFLNKSGSERKKMSRQECEAAVEKFNTLCPSLPSVKVLTDTRIKALQTAKGLLKETSFEDFFRQVEASDFITGRTGTWAGASFDWILKKSNLLKIIEGNYDNRRTVKETRETSFDVDDFFQAAIRKSERKFVKG